MKEKILKVLNEATKSLDPTSIMRKIQEEYETEDLSKLIEELKELENDATLVCNTDNEYMLFERSNLKKGEIEITKTGNAFLLLEKEKDLFIPSVNLQKFNIMDKDTVVVEAVKVKKGKVEGKIIKVLERNLDSGIGEIYFENGKPMVKLVKNEQNINLTLESTDLNLVEGLLVKLKFVKDINEKNTLVKIEKIICHKNAPDVDILTILGKLNIPTEWSEKALEEAKNTPKDISNVDLSNREDLRDETIVTIDGADTKDIDDAVSLIILPNGNWLLKVSIAAVSEYVKEGSELKKEALKRGNSVYLADRVVPMLPIELSNGICSLNPNVDRLAKTCEMEINHKGQVVNSRIYRSVMRSCKKMTYEEVNKLFDGNPSEDYLEYSEVLNNMLELSELMNKVKILRGEVEFISPEVKLIVDENGKVTDIKRRVEGKAQKIIENFMILANTTIATHMKDMNSPFVYRVHESPSPEKLKECIKFINILGNQVSTKINYNNVTSKDIQSILEELKDNPNYEIINQNMLRSMQKARYYEECLGHFALALEKYTHFTSPIRRYCDTMVHYFLDECYFNGNMTQDFVKFWENNLPYICEHISETEVLAESAEREVNKMKIAEYMIDHINDEYDATIDGTLQKGFFIITQNLISGFVSLETLDGKYSFDKELMGYTKKGKLVYRLGDKVRVQCIGASKEERRVDFTLVRGK